MTLLTLWKQAGEFVDSKPGGLGIGKGKGDGPSFDYMHPWPKDMPQDEWHRTLFSLSRLPKPTAFWLRDATYRKYVLPDLDLRDNNRQLRGGLFAENGRYVIGTLDKETPTPLEKATPEQKALLRASLKRYVGHNPHEQFKWIKYPGTDIELPFRTVDRGWYHPLFHAYERLRQQREGRPVPELIDDPKQLSELKKNLLSRTPPGEGKGGRIPLPPGQGKGYDAFPYWQDIPGSLRGRGNPKHPDALPGPPGTYKSYAEPESWYTRPGFYLPAGLAAGLLGGYGLYNWFYPDKEKDEQEKQAGRLGTALPGRPSSETAVEVLDDWARKLRFPSFKAYADAQILTRGKYPSVPAPSRMNLYAYPGLTSSQIHWAQQDGPGGARLYNPPRTAPAALNEPAGDAHRRQVESLGRWAEGLRNNYLDFSAKNPGLDTAAALLIPGAAPLQSAAYASQAGAQGDRATSYFHGGLSLLNLLPGFGGLARLGRMAGAGTRSALKPLVNAAARRSPLLGRLASGGRSLAGGASNLGAQLLPIVPAGIGAAFYDASRRSAPDADVLSIAKQHNFDPHSEDAWKNYYLQRYRNETAAKYKFNAADEKAWQKHYDGIADQLAKPFVDAASRYGGALAPLLRAPVDAFRLHKPTK